MSAGGLSKGTLTSELPYSKGIITESTWFSSSKTFLWDWEGIQEVLAGYQAKKMTQNEWPWLRAFGVRWTPLKGQRLFFFFFCGCKILAQNGKITNKKREYSFKIFSFFLKKNHKILRKCLFKKIGCINWALLFSLVAVS